MSDLLSSLSDTKWIARINAATLFKKKSLYIKKCFRKMKKLNLTTETYRDTDSILDQLNMYLKHEKNEVLGSLPLGSDLLYMVLIMFMYTTVIPLRMV
jgi:hypothetical protein